MILFVNAKINIGLQVTGKRPDGYHELSTIFYPVGLLSGTPYSPQPFCDILEVTELPDAERSQFTFTGNRIDCPLEKNLVYRAAKAFAEAFKTRCGHDMPAFDIRLEKHIPDGAGLGGGSADASFTLKALNELNGNVFTDNQLIDMATSLGADCPFFILNTPCIATGIGEVMTPVDLSLEGKWLVIVKPPFGVPTREAFAGIDCSRPHADTLEPLSLQPQQWPNRVENEFEPHIFKIHPELPLIKQSLYDAGAFYAQMSGSGSAIFGIFNSKPDVLPSDFTPCQVFIIHL